MIYPDRFPDDRDHEEAEKRVFKQMKLLPKEFDVFYNRIFSGRKKGERADYEIDFIVTDLRNGRFNGLVCLEVKGGILRCLPDNTWTQNGKQLEKSPAGQAVSGLDSLVRRRFSEVEKKIYYGWMVCFPDGGDMMNDELPAGLEEKQVIGKLKLTWLEKTLSSYFNSLREKFSEKSGMTLYDYSTVFKAPLIRDCDFVLPLSQRLAADEQTFIRLTSKQASTFRLFQINDKILVKGIAGSGKTLIAKEVAQEFYEKGLNVLFLCYNKVLALNIESYFRKGKKVDVSSFLEDPELDSESLTDKVKLKDFAILIEKLRKTSGVDKSKNSIRVERYHSFAYSVIEANDPGWWWGNVSNPDFWNFLISCKLENIKNTGGISPYYDVIIIDEGQDFMEYWFETAKYFLKPEGKFYVFMDEMQNINQACPRIPGLKEFTIASLTENCRNTKNIASELSGIIRQEIKSMDEMPLGEGVVHIRYKNDTDQQTKILSEIKKLTGEKGISPDEILILLNTGFNASCLAQTRHIDKLPLKKLNERGELSDTAINYTNINTFKGLEANIVFIIDTDKVAYDQKVLYTQASRAKHLLYVFEKAT